MKKRLPLLLACLAFLFGQCSTVENEEEQTTAMELPAHEPNWAANANIYEVNIRQYTPEGTIDAFRTDHLERLHEMGVDILWLMPIFPISSTKRKGGLGSYYAVSNFRQINPEFGTMADFEELLQAAHDLDMKIILDWVPNHTGWDHVWIESNPDFYTQKNGEITDPLNDEGESHGWTDVADLNYDNSELRKTMTNDLLYWVEEKGVDGFRMDVAFLVPEDFWNSTIERLRTANPELFLLAEAEEANLRNMEHPFTASYAWSFHHLLNDLAQQKDSLASIDQWLLNNNEKFEQGYNMQFITNHDENSWNGTITERMGEAANAFAVLAFTIEGMPLIYSGQEANLSKRLAFFEKDSINWNDQSLYDFYATLLSLKHRNPALWNGAAGGQAIRISTDQDDHIYAFRRTKADDQVIVILNLSPEAQVFQLNCAICEGRYSDVFKGETMEISNTQEINLGAWAYQVVEKEGDFEE
ncbi:MAG: alpha-amylase family glycosyl hydrolase [Bacteroidota bacterium]